MPDRAIQGELNDDPRRPVTADQGISLLTLSNILLRERRFILVVAGALALLTAVQKLLRAREYTVSSSFMIQNQDQSAAASLAAQLGVDVGGIDASQSPILYSALLKMPDILGRLADSVFVTSDEPNPRSLAKILDIDKEDAKLRRAEVMKRLDRLITSTVGLKIDVVTLTVKTRDPLLSRQIAEALLAELNRFNLVTRQSRAAAERKFTEQRLSEVGAELRVAEDRVQSFFQQNRQSYLSAGLELEKQRLGRRLELVQQTYVTLSTAHERARIDEVRDTPVITIIQRPETPVRPDPRGIVSKTIMSFFLGLGLGALLALGRAIGRSIGNSDASDAREFSRLLEDASADIRRLRSAVPGLSRSAGKPVSSH